jgi:hypothetical protein
MTAHLSFQEERAVIDRAYKPNLCSFTCSA